MPNLACPLHLLSMKHPKCSPATRAIAVDDKVFIVRYPFHDSVPFHQGKARAIDETEILVPPSARDRAGPDQILGRDTQDSDRPAPQRIPKPHRSLATEPSTE